MFHGWGFWSLFWLLLNILMWLTCLMGGWMLVREIQRQLRPPSEPKDQAPPARDSVEGVRPASDAVLQPNTLVSDP